MLASQQGHIMEGVLMLLAYSLGLGIPFLLSAVLIDALRSTFDWIKRHYGVINRVCGGHPDGDGTAGAAADAAELRRGL